MKKKELKEIERRLGIRFRRRELLERALTHRSYANEQALEHNYERLEFLGDSVLGLLTAEWLYESRPEMPEGGLSELKAYLVSRPVLAEHATAIGLGEALQLGVGEERSGGRDKPSLLADAFEAVIGAVYLDRGSKRCRKLLVPMFERSLEDRGARGHTAAKTRLQELVQARSWPLPEYRHVAQEGPDHRKRFTVECWVDGRQLGSASGRSKKVAEQKAAAEALEQLGD